jgi:hypothetical protein
MPRLDRGIQYSAALVLDTDPPTTCSGILDRPVPGDDDWNQKAGSRPAVLVESSHSCWEPGRSEAPPGLEGYFLDFFFDFDFFAFFAFFAFLAIVSSQGLMDGNATRGMLGGGPASQHPQMQSQQIRGALPRTVTLLLLRYPQLLCVFGAISQNFRSSCPD